MDRRAFLKAGSLAAAGLAGTTMAHAAEPEIWMNMTQKELDAAYTQSVYAANWAQVSRRYALTSAWTRRLLGEPERIPYGRQMVEALDLFRAGEGRAPVHIFIHGGAWKSGTARDYSFVAAPFVQAGIACVLPDFSSVEDADGDLGFLAGQLRRLVRFVYASADSLGLDRDRLYISGHSSGAHLAAVLLATDWTQYGLPATVLKGGMCCSGMYDLKPVRLSCRRSYVHITDEIEEALSPQRHVDRLNAPLLLVRGSLETPEFIRQTDDFARACRAGGRSVQTLVLEEYNHFEVLEPLGNPCSELARATLKLMGSRALAHCAGAGRMPFPV